MYNFDRLFLNRKHLGETMPNQMKVILLFLFIAGSVYSQTTTSSPQSVFDYLTGEEGGKLLLELNMKKLLSNRKSGQYMPAKLTDASGKTLELQVRTRGKFRRKRCEIPPIKMKFRKSVLREAGLDTLNEIKLVLPCANRPANEQLIVREYVAYRMFETLNPEYSTHARLVRLQLKDFKRKRPKKMFAMLVEHEEEVSARLRSIVNEQWGVKPDELDADQTAMMTVFQYLIGNTDWETVTCRNVMLLQTSDSSKIFPVPYDFDFSGLVSAPYASPSSTSGLVTVRDRYLMSADNGVSEAALEKARQHVLVHKDALYKWAQNKYLSTESVADMRAFLDVFFEAARSPSTLPLRLELPKE